MGCDLERLAQKNFKNNFYMKIVCIAQNILESFQIHANNPKEAYPELCHP